MYIREIFSQYTQPLGWLCTAALHSRWLCTAIGLAVHSHWAGCAQPRAGCAQPLGWHSGWLCTAAELPVHCRCEYFCYGYTFISIRKKNSMHIWLYSQFFSFEFKYKGRFISTGLAVQAVHSRWAGCAQPLGWLCTATGLAVHSHRAGTVAGCAQPL